MRKEGELDISPYIGYPHVFIGYDLRELEAGLLVRFAHEQIRLGLGQPADRKFVRRIRKQGHVTPSFIKTYAQTKGIVDIVLALSSIGEWDINILLADPNSSS